MPKRKKKSVNPLFVIAAIVIVVILIQSRNSTTVEAGEGTFEEMIITVTARKDKATLAKIEKAKKELEVFESKGAGNFLQLLKEAGPQENISEMIQERVGDFEKSVANKKHVIKLLEADLGLNKSTLLRGYYQTPKNAVDSLTKNLTDIIDQIKKEREALSRIKALSDEAIIAGASNSDLLAAEGRLTALKERARTYEDILTTHFEPTHNSHNSKLFHDVLESLRKNQTPHSTRSSEALIAYLRSKPEEASDFLKNIGGPLKTPENLRRATGAHSKIMKIIENAYKKTNKLPLLRRIFK